jgi:hypothetical protein
MKDSQSRVTTHRVAVDCSVKGNNSERNRVLCSWILFRSVLLLVTLGLSTSLWLCLALI